MDNAAPQDTDDAPAVAVLAAVRHCANSWEGSARLLGNVRASDIARACSEAIAALTRITGAADIVDEAACLIWSELCPDTVMGDEDRPYYEAAAKAVLALSPAPEGEAVAWQKRPVFGDIRLRVWTPVEADPEVQDFWRTVNYEIRPLYATPQSISTREAVIEECAKVCEGLRHVDYPSETSEWSSGTFDCAQAIRALRAGK